MATGIGVINQNELPVEVPTLQDHVWLSSVYDCTAMMK